MDNIQIFSNNEFGEIRTVIIENEPWFVAMDISDKLGYAQTANMLKQVATEDKRKVASSDLDDSFSKFSNGVAVINESGLYDSIFGSKLKNAKSFRRWVTSEVLPSIRKTGQYGQPQLPQAIPEQIKLLAQGTTELYQRVDKVTEEVQTVKQQLEDFKETLPLLPEDADEVKNALNKKVVEFLGGKDSNAYHNKSLCQKVFADAYRSLKYNFNVGSYKSIKRNQKTQALQIIEKYEPPLFLAEQIADVNTQQSLDLEGGVQ